MAVKTSFTFDAASLRALETLAERRGVKKSEIIRRALMLYDFVTDDLTGDEKPEVIVRSSKRAEAPDKHVLVP